MVQHEGQLLTPGAGIDRHQDATADRSGNQGFDHFRMVPEKKGETIPFPHTAIDHKGGKSVTILVT